MANKTLEVLSGTNRNEPQASRMKQQALKTKEERIRLLHRRQDVYEYSPGKKLTVRYYDVPSLPPGAERRVRFVLKQK